MAEQAKKIEDALLRVSGITLSFGGVRALDDVSFEIKEHEILAIIGPNGAGKSSMLNVINGFYHPQEGTISFKGRERKRMRPHVAASQGIARTFQNIALFKGMSTLDNIMTGRMLKMKRSFLWHVLYWGPALKEEIENREVCEKIIDFLETDRWRRLHRAVRDAQLRRGSQGRGWPGRRSPAAPPSSSPSRR